MEASTTPVPLGRRFSLLSDPWHNSSRLVVGLMLLFLLFCNLPGQHVKRIWYEVGHPFYVKSQFEHGWPLTYLIRAEQIQGPNSIDAERTVRRCFEFWSDVAEFRTWILLANACVVLLASAVCGVAFEGWRRARRRLWHIHLRDLLVLVLAASLGGAWYFYAQQRHAEQVRTIGGGLADTPAVWTDNQEGGITWLRLWIGGEALLFLDRPFSVVVHQCEGWRQLETLATAREILSRIRGTTEELAHLAEMPQLEALDLADESLDAPPDDIVAELPPLPRLRGLCLSQPAHRSRRLDRLTGLEALRISQGCIDDQALREIGALPKLRELSLNHLPESANLTFLPSLPNLSALDLYYGSLNGAALQSVGRCSRLKVLSLYMCHVDGSGVRHLSNLADLETLDLNYTNVTGADLEALATLTRLRQLKLTNLKVGGGLRFATSLKNLETLELYNTNVNDDDVGQLVGLNCLRTLDLGYTTLGAKGRAYLRHMKQLKWLRVSIGNEVERSALQEALPDCEIVFHF